METTATTQVTIEAFGLGETWTINVPADADLTGFVPHVQYGPHYRRWVVEMLKDVDAACRPLVGNVEWARHLLALATEKLAVRG